MAYDQVNQQSIYYSIIDDAILVNNAWDNVDLYFYGDLHTTPDITFRASDGYLLASTISASNFNIATLNITDFTASSCTIITAYIDAAYVDFFFTTKVSATRASFDKVTAASWFGPTLKVGMPGNKVLVGEGCGNAITTGNWNTGVGNNALNSLQSGHNNTVLGFAAGKVLTSSDNTLIGSAAGYNLTNCQGNTFVGRWAAAGAVTASANVVVGWNSALDLASGDKNVILGYWAGTSITNGDYNIVIGAEADVSGPTASNEINIGDTYKAFNGIHQLPNTSCAIFKQTSAVTYADVTETKIDWDTEDYDNKNEFSSVTFTPTVAGVYDFTAQFATIATQWIMGNTLIMKLYVGGSVVHATKGFMEIGTSYNAIVNITKMHYVAANATCYFTIYIDRGAGTPSLGDGTYVNGSITKVQ